MDNTTSVKHALFSDAADQPLQNQPPKQDTCTVPAPPLNPGDHALFAESNRSGGASLPDPPQLSLPLSPTPSAPINDIFATSVPQMRDLPTSGAPGSSRIPIPSSSAILQTPYSTTASAARRNSFNWSSPQLRTVLAVCTVLLLSVAVTIKLNVVFGSIPSQKPNIAWASEHPAEAKQMRTALDKMKEVKSWIHRRYSSVTAADPASASANDEVSTTLDAINVAGCPAEFQHKFVAHKQAWENFEGSEMQLLDFRKRTGTPWAKFGRFVNAAIDIYVRHPNNPYDRLSAEEQHYIQNFADSCILVNTTRHAAEQTAIDYGLYKEGATQ